MIGGIEMNSEINAFINKAFLFGGVNWGNYIRKKVDKL